MPGPFAGVIVRYVVQRGAATLGKAALKQIGKRTHQQRMAQVAAKRGGRALPTALQGPYTHGANIIVEESRVGQHTASSRMARTKARKSIRGPSAKREAYSLPQDTRGHKVGTRGPCGKGYVYRVRNGRHMCVPRK